MQKWLTEFAESIKVCQEENVKHSWHVYDRKGNKHACWMSQGTGILDDKIISMLKHTIKKYAKFLHKLPPVYSSSSLE